MKFSTVFHKYTFPICAALCLGLSSVSCGGSAGGDAAMTRQDSLAVVSAQADALLEARCVKANAQFPLVIDDFTTQTAVEVLPEKMVHTFSIDEKKLGLELDNPNVSKDALYQGIIEALRVSKSDSTMLSEMQALVTTGRGLLYKYSGAQSGKTLEVEVAPATLKEIVE
ncbi:MAG: hypothetical protein K2I02_08150 [Duncaniella sp.]|nr:hypothetical protein [Duncaniella sp.]MDE5915868.1 hypothetical protein [Duncaniella sp.]